MYGENIMSYLTVIKYATMLFPLVAFFFTIPFILREYHKYGSISPIKSIITYLFIYYLLCAYFLVILPLPKISEVAKMTSPRVQLIPFDFILDFIKNSSFNIMDMSTYLTTMKESYFYVPVFNILLTLPLGIFLRYYFKCNKKRVIFLSFLLSLFFELTQLSGLYFIYPRGYRLFDVDDLILNTFGGLLGYFLSRPITYFIPEIDKVNEKAKEKGKIISGFRRTVVILLDLFIFITIELFILSFFKNNMHLQILFAIFYYIILPLFLAGRTPGQKFLNIVVVDENNKNHKFKLLLRKFLAIAIYILIPFSICNIIFFLPDSLIRELLGVWAVGVIFIFYLLSTLKYIFTNKDMIYEKISKTRLISTVQ